MSDALLVWIRAHRWALAAATGIAAVLALAIAVIVDPGGEPGASPATTTITPAPTTTEPRPVATRPATTTPTGEQPSAGAGATATDWRMVFSEVPDGFELTGAELLSGSDAPLFPWLPTLLFAPADATSASGPWIGIASAPRADQIEQNVGFNRPPATTTIGRWAAVIGSRPNGDEQVVLRDETTTVVLTSSKVEHAALVALIDASTFDGATASVPFDALPPGFVAVDAGDLIVWMTGWDPSAAAAISVSRSDGGAYANVLAFPIGEGPRHSGKSFAIEPLAAVTIGGGSGVAGVNTLGGNATPSFVVMWRHGDRELVATGSTELGLDGVIDLASRIVTPNDPGWHDDDWRQAQRDAANCCRFDHSASEPPHDIGTVDVPGDASWTVDLDVSSDGTTWIFQAGASSAGPTVVFWEPRTGPDLQVASTWGAPFGTYPFHAVAMAVLDRSQIGAVLRLTTTGTSPQTVEVPLQPVPDSILLAPYVVAGAVLPWVDGGFIAQVVAPDGTVISTRTDADLR